MSLVITFAQRRPKRSRHPLACAGESIKNRLGDAASAPAMQVVGLEVLQFLRMGLRLATDKRIRDSVRIADALLKVETPNGAA
jgi:hypothetical protein